MSTCGGWGDLVVKWPVSLAAKGKEQVRGERAEGIPGGDHTGRYRDPRASLDGPRACGAVYMDLDDKEQVRGGHGEGEMKQVAFLRSWCVLWVSPLQGVD